MPTFTELQKQIERTRIDVIVLTLDSCANTFGEAPCTATGTKCYNTWPTCKDRANYVLTSQEFLFSSVDKPIPFSGCRPYLQRVAVNASEMKETLAVKGILDFEMIDEVETTDVGLDPYRGDRAQIIAGSYWKRFIARNENYYGRRVQWLEGYLGNTRAEFVERWRGDLSNFSYTPNGSKWKAEDPLGKQLQSAMFPPVYNLSLAGDLSATETSTMVLSVGEDYDIDKLPDTGFVKIGDEVVSYGTIDRVSGVTSTLGRGLFETDAAAHDAGDDVNVVVYVGPDHPLNIARAVLQNSDDMSVDELPGAAIGIRPLSALYYDFLEDEQGFTAIHNAVLTHDAEEEAINVAGTGGNPRIQTPAVNFSGADNRYVILRIQRKNPASNWAGLCFYKATNLVNYDPALKFQDSRNSQYTPLVF